MAVRTIYLHVGMPKTGTSALQMFLGTNREALEKDGFYYPNFTVRFPEVGANRNGHFLKYVQFRKDEPADYMQCVKELKEMISAHDKIILSEEALWGKQSKKNWWKSVKKWANELCVDLKIIVYLRRQEDLVESLWNQKIKGFQKQTESFSEFLHNKSYDYLPLDYEKALAEMSKYFGEENLIVRSYDFSRFVGGNIYGDFLDSIGLKLDNKYVTDENPTNISLPVDAVEIKRIINMNAVYAEMTGVNFYDQVIRDAYGGIKTGKKDKRTMFSDEELATIQNEYQQSNEAVAKQYLNRTDGQLFSERKAKEIYSANEEEMFSAAIKILAGGDLYLYQRIEELENEMQAIREKMTENYNNRFHKRVIRKIMSIFRRKEISAFLLGACLAGTVLLTACGGSGAAKTDGKTITNVSYDPTRELYAEYNEMFKNYYLEKTGEECEVVQSHGGSGGQARSVVEGADADVVTLALEHDITMIEDAGLIDTDWISEFDRDSSPYTSTIVFLVRKGNEKNIKDWDDLTKEGVEIIHPDPKSSGGACWNFLAAWNYADKKFSGNEEQIKSFMHDLYANVTVMDSGARGSTTTFVENGQGDVLVAWENEALQTVSEYPDEYEIISPSVSILAQPSVAIVDVNAKKNGTEELSKEYLDYLYSEDAQRLIGEMGYRPSDESVLAEFGEKFDLNMNLCTISDFGGWDAAYETYFTDGGVFDEIYGN